MALTREQRALFGGYQDKNIKDSMPKKYRDLKVEIITRINIVDITPLVMEISLFEALDNPFVHGELKFADNSGLITALPIIGQEEVKIKFTRRNKTVEKTFACTRVRNIEKVLGDAAGAVLTLTSKKHLTNSVKLFSKSYSGLASDIIQQIHKNNFNEDIEIKTPSGSAHNVVFPFSKPYSAIKNVIKKTYGDDGTPYFLFENLFGKKPILQSLESMLKETTEENLPVLSMQKATNKDDLGQGSRYMPGALGALYKYEISKNSDTLKLLSSGALVNNTIRLNHSNSQYTENSFNYEQQAPTIAELDPYHLYELDELKLDSNELKASVSIELYNPIAFESEGVTALGTHTDSFSLTKNRSYKSRLNNMMRISAYCDSDPDNYKVGKCVNLIIAPNMSALEGAELKDGLFSGTYIISRIRHYLKDDEYTVSMELIREGLSKPKSNRGGGGK
jgi:hypothetical protein